MKVCSETCFIDTERLWQEGDGGPAVEYALMLGLIFAVIVGTVELLGINVLSLFTDYNDKYNAAVQ